MDFHLLFISPNRMADRASRAGETNDESIVAHENARSETQHIKLMYIYRKSLKALKSYLNKDKHVRRFKPRKIYSNIFTCFAGNKLIYWTFR